MGDLHRYSLQHAPPAESAYLMQTQRQQCEQLEQVAAASEGPARDAGAGVPRGEDGIHEAARGRCC
eukprot:736332-Hanusia_phi.AAC.1